MALKRLGSLDGAATTHETVYTCPASKEATVYVSACNTTAAAITVRLAIRDGSLATDDYVWYDLTLLPGQPPSSIGPLPMQAGEIVDAYASAAHVAWQVRGDETDISA